MSNNLPTTPGPYWWREKDGDEWELVFVREDSTVPGYEFTVLFPKTGMEIDLPHMQGQWAKAHSPDDGNVAWAIIRPDGTFAATFWSECAAWESFLISPGPIAKNKEELIKKGYTCEPVTIYRKEKE